MEKLINLSRRIINNVSLDFKRYLISKIDTEQRLIGIKGARGTGKTTMLLQLLKTKPASRSLYVSLDNLYFSTNSLFDLAEQFVLKGGIYLYFDEVHKYANWSQELKNIYDSFPELKIIFTSSSALEIKKGNADLSRRALMFELPGLSFREFLEFKYGIKNQAVELQELIYNFDEITSDILTRIKPYEFFEEYLRIGYYPFFKEDEENYLQRLESVINLVVETDLPAIYQIDFSSVLKLKKLITIIGGIAPYKPNMKKLSERIGAKYETVLKYLSLLHNAHILRWLSSNTTGINFMNKPDKLFLENTNIAYAVSLTAPDTGALRETFLLNQLSSKHYVSYSKQADFVVDNKYTFEIGGKNKTKKQIHGIENSFVVKDNIEYGFDNVIPLWLFGFLY